MENFEGKHVPNATFRTRVDADWVERIRDVEQDAVAGAGAGREVAGREHGDVVALVRAD